MSSAPVVVLAVVLAGCASSTLPPSPALPGLARVHGRLPPDACRGVDTRQDFGHLDERALVELFHSERFEVRIARERTDLVYLDIGSATGAWVRLRVAILPSTELAGEELHRALLQHGPGSWGVHRANLAVLAPAGTMDRVVAFATWTKLACWGVLTVAGPEDAVVVGGGYREL